MSYRLTNFLGGNSKLMPTLTSGVGINYGGSNRQRPNHRGNDYAGEPNLGQALLGCRWNVKGKLYRMPFHGNGFGNWVYVKCDDGFGIIYAHLEKFGAPNGSNVDRNSIWGYCGSTGLSTGPHVHVELHRRVPKGAPTVSNILWSSAVNYSIIPRPTPPAPATPPKPPKPDYIEYKNVKQIRIWK